MNHTQKIKDSLKRLLKHCDTNEIFTVLTSIDDGYLKDEVLLWLQIEQGINAVKLKTLNEQMEFERSLDKIIPYHNDQQTNVFLTY